MKTKRCVKPVVVLLLLSLSSCGARTPIISGESPFIVDKISRYDDTHSKYTARDGESGVFRSNFSKNPVIVLPSRMYNIGDTIRFQDFTRR